MASFDAGFRYVAIDVVFVSNTTAHCLDGNAIRKLYICVLHLIEISYLYVQIDRFKLIPIIPVSLSSQRCDLVLA